MPNYIPIYLLSAMGILIMTMGTIDSYHKYHRYRYSSGNSSVPNFVGDDSSVVGSATSSEYGNFSDNDSDTTETGAEPATETGAEPATETGTKLATKTGAKPATETGAEPATETGAKPATELLSFEYIYSSNDVIPMRLNPNVPRIRLRSPRHNLNTGGNRRRTTCKYRSRRHRTTCRRSRHTKSRCRRR